MSGFTSKGQNECRRVLEKYHLMPFKSARPHWLRNPKTGRRLEIDCYCEETRLGAEYDGEQHYVDNDYFKTTSHSYGQRDASKDNSCHKNGVFLIRIPYTIDIDDIENYIIERIPKHLIYKDVINPNLCPRIINGITDFRTDKFPFDVNYNPWYKEAIKLNDIISRNRYINWFYDKDGNSGKTRLCDYMESELGDNWITMTDLRDLDPIEAYMAVASATGWSKYGIIFDISKAHGNSKIRYNVLREIISGYIDDYRKLTYNPIHVIVLCDFLPKIDQINSDQWKILNITNGECHPFTI